jgi:hypothetical protein
VIPYIIGISISHLIERKYLRFLEEQAVKRGGYIKAHYRIFTPAVYGQKTLPTLVFSYKDIEFFFNPVLDKYRNYFIVEFSLPFRAFYNIYIYKRKRSLWNKILSKEITKTGRRVITMGNPVFNNEYIVESNDEKVTLELVNSEIQEFLIKFNFIENIKIFQNKFTLIYSRILEEDRLEGTLKIVKLFSDRLISLR